MSDIRDVRVVVGIDFGTTYSGFAFAHKTNKVIITNDTWPSQIGQIKTNTVLQYDENFENIKSWGFPALAKKPNRKEINEVTPVELFKLHLADIPESEKPPIKLPYEKAITDYLREMGKLIKETVTTRWPGIDFTYQVLYVLLVPANFPENSKKILRRCAKDAGLITNLKTAKLQFTTEPEAAAIHCIGNLDNFIEKSFLVVDCGGGTVDLTIRKLIKKDEMVEMTMTSAGFCGGVFVDLEFIKFVAIKVGEPAIDLLKKNHYGQYQFLIHEFCRHIKWTFTGIEENYMTYNFDIEEICPALQQYVTGSKKDDLVNNEWVIELPFKDVKSIFDNVISNIIRLIHEQLNADKTCLNMFLVGGLSESKYLQKRIKEEFKNIHITIPHQPIAAVVRGAVKYGLNRKIIINRVLKYNYGRTILRPYVEGIDPPERKREGGQVLAFHQLFKKGATIKVDTKFSQYSIPEDSNQTKMWFQLMIAEKDDAKYPDEEGVKVLGHCIIDLPDVDRGKDRKVYSEICFGTMEIEAYAKNEYNGKEYRTTFEYCDY